MLPVYAVSEPTSLGLSGRGAICLCGVQTYLQSCFKNKIFYIGHKKKLIIDLYLYLIMICFRVIFSFFGPEEFQLGIHFSAEKSRSPSENMDQ